MNKTENIAQIIGEIIGTKNNTEILKEFVKNGDEGLDDMRDILNDTYVEIIKPFYNNINISATPGIFNFLLEPLKNANYYSDCDDLIKFRLILSKKGIIASYNDGGNYFKSEFIKECYEKRIPHLSKYTADSKQVGYGVGTRLLYDLADLIYVDSTDGTLYAGLLINNKMFLKTN